MSKRQLFSGNCKDRYTQEDPPCGQNPTSRIAKNNIATEPSSLLSQGCITFPAPAMLQEVSLFISCPAEKKIVAYIRLTLRCVARSEALEISVPLQLGVVGSFISLSFSFPKFSVILQGILDGAKLSQHHQCLGQGCCQSLE